MVHKNAVTPAVFRIRQSEKLEEEAIHVPAHQLLGTGVQFLLIVEEFLLNGCREKPQQRLEGQEVDLPEEGIADRTRSVTQKGG